LTTKSLLEIKDVATSPAAVALRNERYKSKHSTELPSHIANM